MRDRRRRLLYGVALLVALCVSLAAVLLYRSATDPIGSSERVVIKADQCGRFSFSAQGHRWTNNQQPPAWWSQQTSGTFTRTGSDDGIFADDNGLVVHLHSERQFDTLDCYVNEASRAP